jgi:hypothetical protein
VPSHQVSCAYLQQVFSYSQETKSKKEKNFTLHHVEVLQSGVEIFIGGGRKKN